MADGISRAVGRLRGLDREKGVIQDATKSSGFRDEVLQAVRGGYDAQAIWYATGRCVGISQATLLLASLCQHEGQLGELFFSETPGGQQVRPARVQSLPGEAAKDARSPQGWMLSEQCAQQLGDTLSELSQESAPFRQLIVSLAGFTGGPLDDGVPGRVGILKGYGNAIVPQQAAIFIEASYD
jgi:hypothetical protein